MKTPQLLLLILFVACTSKTEQAPEAEPQESVRYVERLMPALDQLISADATIEVLDSGYTWTEGPVWSETLDGLLYCDIPANRIFLWTEAEGSRVYLDSSGYTGNVPRGGEMGSNGLWIDPDDRLVLCQHGNRALAVMNAPLTSPEPDYSYLVDSFDGKRLNSPNDLVRNSAGDYYFTDPPYGLENMEGKEMDFQGVYKVDLSGAVTLVSREMSRPNGIGLSPDESRLYVANSDGSNPVWRLFTIEGDSIRDSGVFLDASDKIGPNNPGGPDGLKVHSSGVIFATGPGGVWVITPDAEVLGIIRTGVPTANCAFNADESMLYMTADDYLMRIPLIAP